MSSALRGSHSLEFFNGQLLFRSATPNGDQYKFVSPAAVAAAFQNAPIDSGWLAAGVVRCGSTPQGKFAALFVSPGPTKITIEGRTRALVVKLPALVFFGIGPDYFVWSVKQKEFAASADLYRAPLPNVFDSGRICWGANKPPLADAKTITAAWELFITSPFSDHAANGKSNSHRNDIRPLLVALDKTKRSFPLAELQSYHTPLERMIETIIGGGLDDNDDNIFDV